MKHKTFSRRILAFCLMLAMLCSILPVGAFATSETDAPAAETATTMVQTAEQEKPAYPFMDTSLSFEERAADLVSRLTLEEKIAMMGARERAVAIPRLGIERWSWGGEANHGLSWVTPPVSSFPTGSAMSSSWNPELIRQVAGAISDEARGLRALVKETNNPGLAQLNGGALSFWAPTMNLDRDPRWGRADECYGEDPYLTAELAGSFVDGMQGDDETYLKTVPCLKHFLANNCEANRYNGNSQFDERTLREYYAKPFQEIVENTGISQVMTSYNRVNGIPVSANNKLLDEMLRKTWGFDGLVATDCGAISMMDERHKWVPEGWDHVVTPAEAVALALEAGTDANCGSRYSDYGAAALATGLTSVETIDRALLRAFIERMRTGEFDPDSMVAYTQLDKNELGHVEHDTLTRLMAEESVVLLKNDTVEKTGKPVLPIDASAVSNIAVVSHNNLANSVQLGGYSIHTAKYSTSPLTGLTNKMKTANPEAKVTAYQPQGGGATTAALFNIDKFVLTTKDGKTITLEAEAAELTNCVNEGANIGMVQPTGASVRFPKANIDMKNIENIKVVASCHPSAMGGVIECQYGNPQGLPNGKSLGSTQVSSTGNWNIWKEFTITPSVTEDDITYEGDLYFVFKQNQTSGSLSEADAKAIAEADVAVVYVGTIEGTDHREDMDRGTIALPRQQAQLVRDVLAVNPNTVVYIQSAPQVDLESFKDTAPSIIWTGYNGQEQGQAFANLLLGDVNPSGKLNYTWYSNESDLANITDYTIRSSETNKGRTYQYFKEEVTYPFGHGLSYTDFTYSNMTIDKTSGSPNDTVTVTVDIANKGTVAGKEIAQLYVVNPKAGKEDRPAKQLRGFAKTDLLEPGASETVTFTVPMDELYYWDESGGKRAYDEGDYTFQVGASSDDIKFEETFKMSGQLTPKLNVVTATPDTFIFDLDKGVTTSDIAVTACMNDESFRDVNDAKITYTSRDERVATVSKSGKITAVGGGTSTITVSVELGGVTKTEDFPVVVLASSGLRDILVDGKSLTGFQPDKTSYSYAVNGTKVPNVTAVAANGVTPVIVQADAIPGAATVTVTQGAQKIVYTVKFQNLPESTDFTTGVLDEEKWEIIGKDKNSSISENGLKIATQWGDIIQGRTSIKNLYLCDAPGDWTMESKLEFAPQPTLGCQQGDIIVYQDMDNYIKLCCEGNGTAASIKLLWEVNGVFASGDAQAKTFSGTTLYYRLTKEGNRYTGEFSSDGKTYTSVGSHEIALNNVKAGLFATNGEFTPPAIDVTYKYVNFTNGAQVCTCDLYDLAFDGETTLTLPEDGALEHPLAATAKVRGGCVMDGHADGAVTYAYTIASGAENTANATIEEGALKASQAGNVAVTVTATLAEAAPRSVTTVFEIQAADAPEQTPITGSVAITGDAVYGVTLTANTSSVLPAGATLSYAWMRGETAVGTDGATYMLGAEDIGKMITLTVSGTGAYTGTLSATTTAVEKATQAVPTGIGATNETAEAANDGTLTGVTTAMQYKSESAADTEWTACGADSVGSLAPGKYLVRYAATATHKESQIVTITILAFDAPDKAATPQAVFDASTMRLTAVTEAMKYAVNDGAWTAITGTEVDLATAGLTDGSTLHIYQPGNGESTSDSDEQVINLTKAAAPSGLGKTDETEARGDGTITGVNDTMEYKITSAAQWAPCLNASITSLIPGSYAVRVKGAGTVLASEGTTITIAAFAPEVAQHTVTFETNSGSTIASVDVNDGETVSKPTDPTKSGYTFVGWYSDAQLTAAYDFAAAVTEDITLHAKWNANSTTGGGGGGSTKPPVVEKNPDGSTSSIVTDEKTGTVTETAKYPDGSAVKTTTTKDGKASSVVTVPQSGKKTTVTIPTDKKPNLGTVAVIVNPDGTRKVVKTSVSTGDGIKITLSEGATIELIDNTKTFIDVKLGDWHKDAVTFATSRELFNGTSADSFAPTAPMTRAMLMTVLYRYEGASAKGEGDSWYADSMAWAKEIALSDGTNPDGSVTREQLATMLYRYANPTETANADTSKFTDGGKVSAYATEAMNWAIATGLITGKANNLLDPQGNATRAEVATILMRFCENVAP